MYRFVACSFVTRRVSEEQQRNRLIPSLTRRVTICTFDIGLGTFPSAHPDPITKGEGAELRGLALINGDFHTKVLDEDRKDGRDEEQRKHRADG